MITTKAITMQQIPQLKRTNKHRPSQGLRDNIVQQKKFFCGAYRFFICFGVYLGRWIWIGSPFLFITSGF